MSVAVLHNTRLSNAAGPHRTELTGTAVDVAVLRPDQIKFCFQRALTSVYLERLL